MNIFFIPVEFSFFFFVVFVGGVLCLFYFMTLVSGSVYFGRVNPGGFSGGPGHVFFLCGAPLCGMSVRYNLFGR